MQLNVKIYGNKIPKINQNTTNCQDSHCGFKNKKKD